MCSILKVLSALENVPLSLKRTRIISRYSTPIRSNDGAYNFSEKSGGFTKFVQAGSLINETFLVLFLVGCLSFYLWQ